MRFKKWPQSVLWVVNFLKFWSKWLHFTCNTLSSSRRKKMYFQLQNEKFWLNVQDTYLAAFIQKNYFLFHLSKYHAILSDPYWNAFGSLENSILLFSRMKQMWSFEDVIMMIYLQNYLMSNWGNKILQYFKTYKSSSKAASLCGDRGFYCFTSIKDNA